MLSLKEQEALSSNLNTGVEYEYALYYALLKHFRFEKDEKLFRNAVIDKHPLKAVILDIEKRTKISSIISEVLKLGESAISISIETQNDKVGPADIVIHFPKQKMGISVKYSNTCNLNVSGRYFLSQPDMTYLKEQLTDYSKMFIADMQSKYGNAKNWFRNRAIKSPITEEYIDLIRERVIKNWATLKGKKELVHRFFQEDSPIPFWIYEYKSNGSYSLITNPPTLTEEQIQRMTIQKLDTSYVLFKVDNRPVGKMQVKFNNGFLEHCKKATPDFIIDGIRMSKGSPLSSWNFSLIYTE